MSLFNKITNSIKAVYEDDLIGYLKSTGLYNKIVAGELRCVYCGNPITLENLEIIVPKGKEVELVCKNKNCLNQL